MLRELAVKLNIVNLVVTAELKQPVDLERLVYEKSFLYDAAIYRCAYLKDKNTKSKVSIFSTGKMISVGSKSIQTAKHDLHYASRRLAELGLITPTRITVKLQNIVATGELGHSIDIENLATRLPNVIYEPEQFPGAIYYATELAGAWECDLSDVLRRAVRELLARQGLLSDEEYTMLTSKVLQR